jgi:hypothetical protein
MTLGEDAPEEMGPPLSLRQRLNLSAELVEIRNRLRVRATGGQCVEALGDNVRMPGCRRDEHDLVTGSSERPGERKQRPEVAVERRRAEENADRKIIAHGKNSAARIV